MRPMAVAHRMQPDLNPAVRSVLEVLAAFGTESWDGDMPKSQKSLHDPLTGDAASAK
ncbi:hypothetical protein D3C72_1970900 [compost metagenome]